MGCDTYSVAWGEVILAKGMSLENAMLFVEALFQKFWNDPACFYTIVREPKAVASA